MITDFFVRYAGTLILLLPQTDSARQWAEDNLVIDSWQDPDRIAIGARYWDPIAEGLQDAGLSYTFV